MADRATPSDQYQVTIVKYGHRSTTRSDVYLNYAVYGEPDEPIDMDYFFWVIRNSERTVLVDTGFSRAGGKARRADVSARPRGRIRPSRDRHRPTAHRYCSPTAITTTSGMCHCFRHPAL